MDFTFELGKMFNVLPFEIFKQDKDEVIMLINYMSEKGVTCAKENKPTNKSEKDESASFWSAL